MRLRGDAELALSDTLSHNYGDNYDMSRMKTKKSHNDNLRDNYKGEAFHAAMMGKPVRSDLEPPPDKQVRTKQMADEDREDDVIRDITALLAVHPKVLMAWRQNSGMAYNQGGAPVYFYRWVRCKTKMRIVDFVGLLTDGRPFALEAKNRLWTKPSGEREAEQQNFLLTVKYAGGVSGFVTSAEQAQAIIESQPKE